MNWRAMAKAPKDGTHILLAYPSFSDNGQVYVGIGRWVDCPPQAAVERECREAYDQHRPVVPVDPGKPHWEVAYVAELEHGGAYNGHSYEARSATIHHPFGWMPLPKTPKRMWRATASLSYLSYLRD
jgi:hypothetical protein